jgi:hypothetical protein
MGVRGEIYLDTGVFPDALWTAFFRSISRRNLTLTLLW